MTVGELKKLLAGIPDKTEVVEFNNATWHYRSLTNSMWGVGVQKGYWDDQEFIPDKTGNVTVVALG